MNAAGNGPAASAKATPKAPTPDPVAPGAPTSLEATAGDKHGDADLDGARHRG